MKTPKDVNTSQYCILINWKTNQIKRILEINVKLWTFYISLVLLFIHWTHPFRHVINNCGIYEKPTWASTITNHAFSVWSIQSISNSYEFWQLNQNHSIKSMEIFFTNMLWLSCGRAMYFTLTDVMRHSTSTRKERRELITKELFFFNRINWGKLILI